MTVAELKRRLVPGTRLTLVNSLMGPTRKKRTVEKTNSVEIMFSGDGIKENSYSHLKWPKKSQVVETDSGFRIMQDGEIATEYKWGHED